MIGTNARILNGFNLILALPTTLSFLTVKLKIMKLEIKIEQGKLTVNGKTFREMNYFEKRFLNNYIQELKYGE